MTWENDNSWRAFILAAGLGKRMRPLTATQPKPLVRVNGRTLIDHSLDRLKQAGIKKVIANVHYLADQLEAHLDRRTEPDVVISDERSCLLETGGGVSKALPMIGDKPFIVLNSDSIWWESGIPALERIVTAWNPEIMDAMLLLIPIEKSTGYAGPGDFIMDSSGLLRRRGSTPKGLVYMGTAIIHPRLFDDSPEGAFSLNLLFDAAIQDGRLHGIVHDGEWMHVGTPQAIGLAERRLAELGREH